MRPLIGIPCQGNLRSAYRRFCVGQSYCRALEMAGGAPVLIPLLSDVQALWDIYQRLDGLLLAGGGDIAPHHFGQARTAKVRYVDPPRDRVEMLLVRRAVEDNLPVLAICRGIQVLNVALGGTLYQDIPTQIPHALRHNFHPDHPRNYLGHEVEVQPGTRLAGILGSTRVGVNSFHHQALKEVSPRLSVAAFAPDGVIEAVEAQDEQFVLGVQWHPEELVEDDPKMKHLFEVFVEEVGRDACHGSGVV
ncbi:MAG: gamma-glutamyl-gamma-aminobutyrate hydrolase family protein [Chloroflexi bacterium]|nr:gamma-glutamyl-gamma-aminobutyrate hydrolase family protein [Chloroflexota bacterium]